MLAGPFHSNVRPLEGKREIHVEKVSSNKIKCIQILIFFEGFKHVIDPFKSSPKSSSIQTPKHFHLPQNHPIPKTKHVLAYNFKEIIN